MSTAAVRENWEGRVVDGKFPLLRWVGGSAQSTVFLTELATEPKQPAAIKLVPADGNHAESVLSNWRRSADLNHPLLTRVFDFGRCDINGAPLLYVVSEFAEENLAQILPDRALTPAETKELLNPVLDALVYLHSKGLVHTRLKPSNLMVVDNHLKLSTDGLRKSGDTVADSRERSAYDAPEIGSGPVTPAADIWSLGATLVAALTQHPPAWTEFATTEPLIPQSVPAPFHTIAESCLRRDPAARINTAQIKARLQNGAALPTVSRPTPAATTAKSPKRLLLLGALAVLAVLALVRLAWHPPATPKPAEVSQSAPAAPAPETSQPAAAPGSTSPGFVKGAVLQRSMPDISPGARRTVQGKVKVSVRLTVDPSGNVSNATFESAGPSQYFASHALQAARQWKFKPAQMNGNPVPSKWTLHFRFGRSGTEVDPIEITR